MKFATAQLDEDIYLRIARSKEKNYTMYFSHDGKAWTYVHEWNDAPVFNTITLTGVSERNIEFPVTVYSVHFEVPEPR